MRLKIISGGTGASTKIIDRDTGEALEGVVEVEFNVKIGEAAQVRLTINDIELDADTEVDGELPGGKGLPTPRGPIMPGGKKPCGQ